MTPAAFFDLDGTLYDGYVWRAFTRHHLRHRFKLPTLFAYLALHLPLYPLAKTGLLAPHFFYQAWGSHMAWLVRGVNVERAAQIWNWVLDHEICPHLRPEMADAIEAHRRAGHEIVLLSGTLQPLLDTLASRLETGTALATHLAQKNGRYTVRIVPPLNVGQAKADRVRAFVGTPRRTFNGNPARSGREFDLSTSYLYTDSIVDLPVLEIVGNPVAVYPDDRLHALAKARGWKVIP